MLLAVHFYSICVQVFEGSIERTEGRSSRKEREMRRNALLPAACACAYIRVDASYAYMHIHAHAFLSRRENDFAYILHISL